MTEKENNNIPKFDRRKAEEIEIFIPNERGKMMRLEKDGSLSSMLSERPSNPIINIEGILFVLGVVLRFLSMCAVTIGKAIGHIVAYSVIICGTIFFYILVGVVEVIRGIVNISCQQVGRKSHNWYYPERKRMNRESHNSKSGSSTQGQGHITINQTFNN